MQRDPGPSLHVMPDDACVVSAPATSVDAERPTVSPILPPAPASQPTPVSTVVAPVTVRGKFLFAGDQKLYLRGVTYGTFRPLADGSAGRRRARLRGHGGARVVGM